MNEEELKKGCGIEWDINNKHTGEFCCKFICGKGGTDGFKTGYWKQEDDLCPACQTRLEGFQKGKLEQKKEELEWLKELFKCKGKETSETLGSYLDVEQRIEQLSKEIGGMK